ncbi:hypothetical protein MKW92_048592 [Papaver armeniacum]|nr:hypothetical protein MKW92_048592 [Papaver armeniacum]
MDHVLGDSARNFPDARESEILPLFATIINNSHYFVESSWPLFAVTCFNSLCLLHSLCLPTAEACDWFQYMAFQEHQKKCH